MADITIWPAEAIANLGRPLNRWDECPVCGKIPSSHAYIRSSNTYRCLVAEKTTPSKWIKQERLKTIAQESEKMYLAAFELDDIKAAEEAKADGRRRAREKFLAGKKESEPVEQKRKYFDE